MNIKYTHYSQTNKIQYGRRVLIALRVDVNVVRLDVDASTGLFLYLDGQYLGDYVICNLCRFDSPRSPYC